MRHLMIDLNGTLDSYADQLGPMLRALRANGWVVSIVSGVGNDTPDDPETAFAFKVKQLEALDCSDVWDDMTVLSIKDGPELAAAKAQWCIDHSPIDMAVDNNRANVQAIMETGKVPLTLLPWPTRTGKKNDGTSN